MRIQNTEELISHGNIKGREAMVQILETGLQASDPYYNTKKLIRIDNGKLIIGRKEFEPEGTPKSGNEVYDFSEIDRIYVFGAGKGIQRVGKGIEDVLGDKITGGHVIDKKGNPIILERIGVTLGSHPAPDNDNPKGCQKIMDLTKDLTEKDLVFTCVANGVSSCLTMPVPGITIEEIREMTYLMQIEHGAPTGDLNPIRNHLDMMKGGRISRYIHPAKMIHIIAIPPGNYDRLLNRNLWLHTLADFTTFELAVNNLKKWDAWDEVPASIRRHLEEADAKHETVKREEFEKMTFRIFGVMPSETGMVPTAMKKAEELGYKPIYLAERLHRIESAPAAMYFANIARAVDLKGHPFKPPCALFTTGEFVVTVGKATGIGGRNQEFALTASQIISGNENIVIASVDTDGTDGPGTQFHKGVEGIPTYNGGIVDGYTLKEAEEAGVNITAELKNHNSTFALWKLNSGVLATPNISLNDLTVALIMDQK